MGSYGNVQRVTNVLDTIELVAVPIVNPDGYVVSAVTRDRFNMCMYMHHQVLYPCTCADLLPLSIISTLGSMIVSGERIVTVIPGHLALALISTETLSKDLNMYVYFNSFY